MLIPDSLNKCFELSISSHWNLCAFGDYNGESFTYKHVATEIAKLHILFEEAGIKKGDKIAICGRNQSRWAIAFLATLTYGAVAVPILHEFHPEQIHGIVNHSDSKILFVGDIVWNKLDPDKMPDLIGVINNTDFDAYVARDERFAEAVKNKNRMFCEKYPSRFLPQDIRYHYDEPEELAVINYTSGTTSNSKGVMIPYRALWSNMKFAYEVFGEHSKEGDNVVSMLPLAHTYGMSFEFIYEFVFGLHTTFLTKMPTPRVVMQAFKELKPVVLVCVPLIIEKIVRKAILPKIEDPKIRLLMKTPVIGKRIKKRICDGLKEALGGNVYEVIIGGSAINKEIEELLHDIGFNYTVGYGATECSPIIGYEDWHTFVPGSCGKPAPRMDVMIASQDPTNEPGEILVQGMNVMLGYYKNEEATAETLKDGWYHTGDLGIMDMEGNIFIKGRIKNMLLGANGQNIYPEEIEDQLVSMPMVSECVVVQENEKLIGLVYPDMDQANSLQLSEDDLKAVMNENLSKINEVLPAYERLAEIRLRAEEFEKTPKKSIKRYLYTNK